MNEIDRLETPIDWPTVAVVGAGAVGCYFGGMLARAGAPVTMLGRPGSKSPHIQAIRESGYEIRDTPSGTQWVRTVQGRKAGRHT